jgi:membrane fusion protein (multidrug efflux system)
MRTNLFWIAGLSVLMACAPTDTDKKKAELEKLKKEAETLNAKIATLEVEIAATDTTSEQKMRMVVVQPVTAAPFKSYIQVQGKVDADENVSLAAETGGAVTRINVKVGDEVSVGKVLAETDNKVIQQGIAELQGGLELANTVYMKQKNLWDQKIGTEIQYLTAKNQKESLERKMATLQEQLDMTRIKSPINGVVDAVDIKLGQVTAPGIPIIRVVNFNNLKIKGEVAETHATKIKTGDEVEIIFPDINDTIHAKIDFVAKVINPMTRTFSVQVNLDNKKEYHPNMVAILRIVNYSNEKAIVVPVNLIQKTEEGDYVTIAEKGKAKRVEIKVGKTYNGNTEIVAGLKEGDELVVRGFQDLNEGENIKF